MVPIQRLPLPMSAGDHKPRGGEKRIIGPGGKLADFFSSGMGADTEAIPADIGSKR